MWRNYLVAGIRPLIRDWRHAVITIGGLALGLACSILALLFVLDEISYDRLWPNAERIYRVHTEFAFPGRARQASAATMGPLKSALLREIPEIESAARINVLHPTFKMGDRVFAEDLALVDREFLSLFPVRATAGAIDLKSMDASSLIVTRSFAEKHFSKAAVVGEILTVSYFRTVRDYQVIAVIPDPPAQTHLTYRAFALINEADFRDQPWMFERWTSVNNHTYFKLRPGANSALLPAQLKRLVDKGFTNWPQGMGLAPSEAIRLSAMNVRALQLESVGTGELKPVGNLRTLILFVAIAALILLMAGVNYVNLTTAKSMGRAREVAIRKVAGARPGQLRLQFLSESVLLVFMALGVALALVVLSLPSFSQFVGKDLHLGLLAEPRLLAMLFAATFCIGLLSGLYPAMFVSRFRPATILKGETPGAGRGRLRRLLVVFQFAVAAWLLVATGIVYAQMAYLNNAELGFDHEQTLLVHRVGRDKAAPVAKALKEEILRLPGITSATLAESAPGDTFQYNAQVRLPGLTLGEAPLVGYRLVDEDFFQVYGIKLKAGRKFNPNFATDRLPKDLEAIPFGARKGAVVLNAAAIRYLELGSASDALGRSFLTAIAGKKGQPVPIRLHIIGVVGDVHFRSLKERIRAEMYIFGDRNHQVLTVRYGTEMAPAAIVRSVASVWQKIIPEIPFRAEFLDDVVGRNYAQEAKQASVLALMAALSVLIGCLGLYGLASHVTVRRTGEIGIRKVLGAGVCRITGLLLWQFSLPVAVANLIAWPVAFYFAGSWLSGFAYRIDLWVYGPALCAGALIVAVLIAWFTIIGHAARAARLNPAVTLRFGGGG